MSRYTLMDYFSIYVEEWDSLLEEFLRHLAMTSFSVVLALIIAVPLGIFITRNKAVSNVVIGIANVMQSIPCMALLAMGIPFLGVGETLAIFMVFVYAFLPILKNTYTGISGISPVSMEVARGIGLTRMQQLRRVELPMAMPYIMSGIRIAAVSSVGTMTIAAFAGAKGLGLVYQSGPQLTECGDDPAWAPSRSPCWRCSLTSSRQAGAGGHQRGPASQRADSEPAQEGHPPPAGDRRGRVCRPGGGRHRGRPV